MLFTFPHGFLVAIAIPLATSALEMREKMALPHACCASSIVQGELCGYNLAEKKTRKGIF